MNWLPPLAPLPPHLEALRRQVNSLPPEEWAALYGRLSSDKMQRNDQRHAEAAVAFEKQRRQRVAR